jgi:hypothetical protein
MNAVTGQDVFITDYTRSMVKAGQPPVVSGYSFVGCTIYGPALVSGLHRVSVENCVIEGAGDIESCIWEAEIGTVLIGVVGLDDCAFYDCRFVAIGFVVDEEDADRMRLFIEPA